MSELIFIAVVILLTYILLRKKWYRIRKGVCPLHKWERGKDGNLKCKICGDGVLQRGNL